MLRRPPAVDFDRHVRSVRPSSATHLRGRRAWRPDGARHRAVRWMPLGAAGPSAVIGTLGRISAAWISAVARPEPPTELRRRIGPGGKDGDVLVARAAGRDGRPVAAHAPVELTTARLVRRTAPALVRAGQGVIRFQVRRDDHPRAHRATYSVVTSPRPPAAPTPSIFLSPSLGPTRTAEVDRTRRSCVGASGSTALTSLQLADEEVARRVVEEALNERTTAFGAATALGGQALVSVRRPCRRNPIDRRMDHLDPSPHQPFLSWLAPSGQPMPASGEDHQVTSSARFSAMEYLLLMIRDAGWRRAREVEGVGFSRQAGRDGGRRVSMASPPRSP
jgi:hypothetical protein